MMSFANAQPWAPPIHAAFKRANVRQVAYVPDAGLTELIRLCQADAALQTISLTTEEEGIALAAGAHLGGQRAVVLMQSSGVGNCINMLGILQTCAMPLVLVVTMRGEFGEFNPWQVPMGQAVPATLAAMGVLVHRVNAIEETNAIMDGTLQLAYHSSQRVAVLLSQQLLGVKRFDAEAQ
jgi:sulfopyruvate decarboxylase alpha subunit